MPQAILRRMGGPTPDVASPPVSLWPRGRANRVLHSEVERRLARLRAVMVHDSALHCRSAELCASASDEFVTCGRWLQTGSVAMSAKEFEITCIRKPNRNSPHEHITHIGNTAGKWMLPREVAIQRIEAKTEAYFTTERTTGRKAYVGVVRPAGGPPYLRTHADGKWNDNLLALSECVDCRLI